jgi:hypothetical protein
MKAKLKILNLEYKLRHIFFVGNFEMKETEDKKQQMSLLEH